MENHHLSLPGTKDFFKSQKKGSKGIQQANQKYVKRKSLVPSKHDYQSFQKSYEQIEKSRKRKLLNKYQDDDFNEWLWYLQLDYSLLLFGIGSKYSILRHFAQNSLKNEDTLYISGDDIQYSCDKIIRSLIEKIAIHILKQPEVIHCFNTDEELVKYLSVSLDKHYGRDHANKCIAIKTMIQPINNHPSSSSVSIPSDEDDQSLLNSVQTGFTNGILDTSDIPNQIMNRLSYRPLANNQQLEVNPEWGKRYIHAQARLYIIVDSIDGPLLQSDLAVSTLSALSSSRSVSIIASANTVNTSLLWSSCQLSQFKWKYIHTPTLDSFPLRQLPSKSNNSANSMNYNEFDKVGFGRALEGMTSKHREIIGLFAKQYVNRSTTGNQSNIVVSKDKPSKRKLDNEEEFSIPIDAFVQSCAGLMIVKNKPELVTMLNELNDQNVLKIIKDNNLKEKVKSLVPLDYLVEKLGLS